MQNSALNEYQELHGCVFVEQTFRVLDAKTVVRKVCNALNVLKKKNQNAWKEILETHGERLKICRLEMERGMYQKLRWHFSSREDQRFRSRRSI